MDLSAVEPAEETLDDEALSHLQYVLDETTQESFRDLPREERGELLRTAWAALDPTPTTPVNERRAEHYRRLAYVRRHFAAERDPPWDRRGELLLRYGPPDERREIPGDVVVGLGLVPPKEIWVYRWLGAAFQLEDARFQGDFQDAFALRSTSRVDVERDVSALGVDADVPKSPRPSRDARDVRRATGTDRIDLDERQHEPEDAEAQMARERLARMFERGQVQLEERPRAYLHDFGGGGKLDLVFDVQSFSQDGKGRTRLEVNTAIWAKDLRFRPDGDSKEAVLDVQVALKTRDWRDVDRVAKITRDRRPAAEPVAGRLVVDQVVLAVEPGEYRLALSVQDSLSRDIGIFRTEVVARPFPAGAFAISDIQRAVEVRRAERDEPFVKGDLQIVPYPPGTYPRDRDIVLYFEVYGLALSPTGDALYTVEFVVRPRTVTAASWFGSSKGRVVPGVATAYDAASRSPNVQEYFALDPKTFDEGVYDVEITVRDRVSDRTTSRSATFAVGKR